MARGVPWAIVPRKRLDVAAADLLYGIGKAVTALPSHRAGVTEALQTLWTGEDTMVTLSVRSVPVPVPVPCSVSVCSGRVNKCNSRTARTVCAVPLWT